MQEILLHLEKGHGRPGGRGEGEGGRERGRGRGREEREQRGDEVGDGGATEWKGGRAWQKEG
jgi:hypothetical protein